MTKNIQVQLWVLKPRDGWKMVGFFDTVVEARNYFNGLPSDSQGILDYKFVTNVELQD